MVLGFVSEKVRENNYRRMLYSAGSSSIFPFITNCQSSSISVILKLNLGVRVSFLRHNYSFSAGFVSELWAVSWLSASACGPEQALHLIVSLLIARSALRPHLIFRWCSGSGSRRWSRSSRYFDPIWKEATNRKGPWATALAGPWGNSWSLGDQTWAVSLGIVTSAAGCAGQELGGSAPR